MYSVKEILDKYSRFIFSEILRQNSMLIGPRPLQQGLSEPEFYGDLVYKLKNC